MSPALSENLIAIRRNLRYLRYFGPGYLKRFAGDRQAAQSAHIKGFGNVHYRYAAEDQEVCEQIFDQRQYDLSDFPDVNKRVMGYYQAILDQGKTPVIIDAGANIGIAALWFHRVFPKAQIVCVEPEPENAKLLRMNIAGRQQISFYEAAISALPGHVEMVEGLAGWSGQTRSVDASADAIASMSVDQLLATVDKGELLIVKIDIEGYEDNLFAENLDWVGNCKVIFVEPHDWKFASQFTSHNMQKALAAHRFELFVKGENLIYVA